MSRVSHPSAWLIRNSCLIRDPAVERQSAIVLRLSRKKKDCLSGVYDIGQSRDFSCQYKFNEDLVIKNKKLYSSCIMRSAAHGV